MKPGATAFTFTPWRPTSRAKRSRKAQHGGLGRAIDRQPAVAGEADDRGDIDDAAAAFRQHGPHRVFRQHDGRHRVDADELLDLGIVHDRERTLGAHRGVVDQAVDRSEVLADLLDQAGYGLDLAEIERHEVDLAALCALCLGDRRRQLRAGLARHRDHAIAGGGELFGDPEAEAAGAAGHDDVAQRRIVSIVLGVSVTHGGRSFRLPTHPASERSGWRQAPCAGAGCRDMRPVSRA